MTGNINLLEFIMEAMTVFISAGSRFCNSQQHEKPSLNEPSIFSQ